MQYRHLLQLSTHTVGHGNSDGDRIHIDDYQTYVADVIQHVELLKSKHPNLPLFIYGESMVRNVLLEYLCMRWLKEIFVLSLTAKQFSWTIMQWEAACVSYS